MFDTQLLTNEKARYVVVAESGIPIVLIILSLFGMQIGPTAGRRVFGRPPGWMFGLVWTTLAVLMCLSLLIAAMNFDTTSLILYASFAFLVMFCCFLWVVLYSRGSRVQANYTLMCVSLFAFLALVTSAQTNYGLDVNSPMAVGLMSTPLPVWTVFAGIMGFLELNR